MGRHTFEQPVRAGRWVLAATVMVGIVVVGGLAMLRLHPLARDRDGASSVGSCAGQARLVVPHDAAAAFAAAAAAFDRTRPGGCPALAVTDTATAGSPVRTATALAPTVWIAEGAAALASLPSALTPSTAPIRVATSPVVISLSPDAAAALGVDRSTRLSNATLDTLLSAHGWGEFGHPSWGALRLVLSDPLKSGSGATAAAALFETAYDGRLPTKLNFADPNKHDLALIRSERVVSRISDSDTAALAGTGAGSRLDKANATAYLTTRMAVDARAAQTVAPLQSLPVAGLSVDFRAVPLAAGGNDPRAATARAFVNYLAGAAGQRALHDAGLGSPKATVPSDAAVRAVQKAWATLHARNSTLALIDASGSMNETFLGGAVSKIGLCRLVTKQAYAVAPAQSISAVWFFHTDSAGTPVIQKSALEANGTRASAGGTHAQSLVKAAADVQASGGTPLYQAVLDGYRAAVSGYTPGRVNQMIVLTDGRDEDSTSRLTLTALVAELRGLVDKSRPVRVRLYAFGGDGDRAALATIAGAVRGKAATIARSADVAPALQALFE